MNFDLNIGKSHFVFQLEERSLKTQILELLSSIKIVFLGLFKGVVMILFDDAAIEKYFCCLMTLLHNLVSNLEGLL